MTMSDGLDRVLGMSKKRKVEASPAGRDVRITFRLTAADRVAFEAAALKSRRNLSDWLVGVGQDAAKPARRGKGGGS